MEQFNFESINNLNETVQKEYNRLNLSVKTEFGRLETELAKTESRIIKQIYVANIVQLLATVGSILAILRFLLAK